MEGTPLELICNPAVSESVNGFDLSIQWVYNGSNITSSHIYTITDHTNSSTLLIHSLDVTRDNNNYSCRVYLTSSTNNPLVRTSMASVDVVMKVLGEQNVVCGNCISYYRVYFK